MTEHDLIDAERLAEWRMRVPEYVYDMSDGILNPWLETQDMVEKMQASIQKLVREVRGSTARRPLGVA